MMWRRFNAFVACKNCGGRPLPKTAKTNPFGKGSQDDGNEVMKSSFVVTVNASMARSTPKRLSNVLRRLSNNGIFQYFFCVIVDTSNLCCTRDLPNHTVLFLSNLPKSVVAFPFYSLEQVIKQIEAIYDDKFESDRADEADGVAREELVRYAEIGLYRFLVSIKNTYQRNSHVRLFARLSNLLKSANEFADDTQSAPSDNKKTGSNTTQMSESDSKRSVKRCGYLDRSFLRVYLEARHYLLRPPPRVARKGKKMGKKDDLGSGFSSPKQSNIMPSQAHVVQAEPTKKWISLDHAITVLRWYISCLPEESVSSYCRQYSTAIYDGHNILEIAGNRLAVRAEMRRVMLANENPEQTSSTPSHTSEGSKARQRPLPPRIVVDVHKVLKLLMDALEQRREGIKEDLTLLFDSGDVNHDCVLTLDEFSAIIRKRKPHFSDRRILRMFREALMGGVDQSFALSMEAFVVVCNDHGLVSLLPDDRMVDPFMVPEISRKAKELETEQAVDKTTTDSSASALVEIPEDISWDDPVLASARAKEVDEEDQQEGTSRNERRLLVVTYQNV
ncbi:unnamed protein product [Phytophthora lilii]|uniref:Unnamed protein product n=1 Tax=Phytophthora lilii TaxID=2077276 RepID=A0A9W6YJ09_9STRA|nr:unnamed protein product [Phytophthora lilii]